MQRNYAEEAILEVLKLPFENRDLAQVVEILHGWMFIWGVNSVASTDAQNNCLSPLFPHPDFSGYRDFETSPRSCDDWNFLHKLEIVLKFRMS